jgi:hypothetical protein
MIYDSVPMAVQQTISSKDVWWEHGQRATIEGFLSQYTVNDSYSRGIQFQQDGSAQALIKFDVKNINPEGSKLGLPTERGYIGALYLCINFTSVHQILSDHAEKYVSDYMITRASTNTVDSKQRALWLELFSKLNVVSKDTGSFLSYNNLHCTTFEGLAENHVYILHSEPTLFLCVKYDGSMLKLPDLELKSRSTMEDETLPS